MTRQESGAAQAKAAVAKRDVESTHVGEPVWFVRLTLLLFFAAFAGYLARELYAVMMALPG